jgi:hypothetical protein
MDVFYTGVSRSISDEFDIPGSMRVYFDPYYDEYERVIGALPMPKDLRKYPRIEKDMRYFYVIRDHLIYVAGKYEEGYRDQFSMQDLEKNVQYVTGKNGQPPFNADKVFRYPLPVKPVRGHDAFHEKYSNCEVLLLHKKDLMPVIFFCFFTKEGYEKRESYFAELEKSFSFK